MYQKLNNFMNLSNTVKAGGVTTGIVGTIGAGYGAYDYLSGYGEFALLTKDNESIVDWHKSAARYFVNLIENPNLENKLSLSDDLTDPSKGDFLKVSLFKDSCLVLLKKENLSQDEQSKRDAWCVTFDSVGDYWRRSEGKELSKLFFDENLSSKYDALVLQGGNVKTFLEKVKTNSINKSNEKSMKSGSAFLWCRLLSNKEYSKQAYEDFRSKCFS